MLAMAEAAATTATAKNQKKKKRRTKNKSTHPSLSLVSHAPSPTSLNVFTSGSGLRLGAQSSNQSRAGTANFSPGDPSGYHSGYQICVSRL